MQFETNNIYHVFNRGNNSQKIFFNRDNYLFFLKKINTHITPFAAILAWCLMPNHLMTTKATCLTDNLEITPAWFQTNFKTFINIKDIDKSYPHVCFNYIHLIPVTVKLFENKDDWVFSSYRDHAGLRNGKLINRERTMDFGLKI